MFFMKPISQMASRVHASTTLAIDSLYKKMKADGLDVVGFGAGEPDFSTPANIVEAAERAMREGKTKYTPASGLLELKAAVCDRMKADCNVSFNTNNVLIASGAKHNLFITFSVLLDPGDEVILPAPFWVSYAEMIAMCGGVPVIVKADEDQNFKITKQAIDNETQTGIVELSQPEVIEEMARLLGGEEITDTVRENAKELIHTARQKKEAYR